MEIKNKKGFTLIELIVTMAIISLLVLLAAPRFFGYTDKAVVAELTTNARAIQDASERYHLDEDDWPRLTDEPYSADEIEAFAEKIYGITGEEVNLDPNGNYYDIDFDKLESYVSIPGDKANYIIQNPVGKVYALQGLTPSRFERLPEGYHDSDDLDLENKYSPRLTDEEISFLINEGYIPIATKDELTQIGTDSSEELLFGQNTQWEGYYDEKLNSKFIQVQDINIMGNLEESSWTPIGDNSRRFSGIYNGGNFTINNLNINMPLEDNVGLFGYIENAKIKNVIINESELYGRYNVGILVGQLTNSSIENSHATGNVTGTRNVGGLVGSANTFQIDYSSSVVNVKGFGINTGGLIGRANSSNSSTTRLAYSYSKGNVVGKGDNTGGLIGYSRAITTTQSFSDVKTVGEGNNTGGLVGYFFSNSRLSNSYSTGAVVGVDRVGGLIGSAGGSSIVSTYSTAKVEGETNLVGGLLGRTDNTTSESRSYYDIDSTNQESSARGTGKSTEEMRQKSTFLNWNFEDIWEIEEGVSYPTLRVFNK